MIRIVYFILQKDIDLIWISSRRFIWELYYFLQYWTQLPSIK